MTAKTAQFATKFTTRFAAKFAAMATLLAATGLAQAQASLVNDEESSPLKCLVQPEGPVNYPRDALKLQQGGMVRVSLSFSAPDRPPEVEVLAQAATEPFLEVVRHRVRQYRLPCLVPSQGPVKAIQTFSFTAKASEPITWSSPREETDPQRSKTLIECIRTPAAAPDYAGSQMDRDVSNVILRALFVAPDQPPRLKVVYSSAKPGFEAVALKHFAQYRLPCMEAGSRPVAIQQTFIYRPYGARSAVFKDTVPLMDFLSNIKGIREQRADFDFKTMGCPFDVAWRLGQPAVPNEVGEIGPRDRNRTEFLAWLAGLRMDLPEARFERLLGQVVRIHVPCGSLQLEPAA